MGESGTEQATFGNALEAWFDMVGAMRSMKRAPFGEELESWRSGTPAGDFRASVTEQLEPLLREPVPVGAEAAGRWLIAMTRSDATAGDAVNAVLVFASVHVMAEGGPSGILQKAGVAGGIQ